VKRGSNILYEVDLAELLSEIRVLVGQDFGCIYWEEK